MDVNGGFPSHVSLLVGWIVIILFPLCHSSSIGRCAHRIYLSNYLSNRIQSNLMYSNLVLSNFRPIPSHPIYLSIYLSIHPSIYLSIHPSIHLSIHPSIHPSIYLSIYHLSIYLSIYFPIFSSPILSSYPYTIIHTHVYIYTVYLYIYIWISCDWMV